MAERECLQRKQAGVDLAKLIKYQENNVFIRKNR